MALPEPLLDTAKLLEQLRELGAIGHDAAQGGRTRIALTDEEKAGRDLLVRWMRELDLEVRVDQIGNIFGVLHAAHPEGTAQPLMMGSHIDTVRNAGALDGCYGVLAGWRAWPWCVLTGRLACARRVPLWWRRSPTKKACVTSRT